MYIHLQSVHPTPLIDLSASHTGETGIVFGGVCLCVSVCTKLTAYADVCLNCDLLGYRPAIAKVRYRKICSRLSSRVRVRVRVRVSISYSYWQL